MCLTMKLNFHQQSPELQSSEHYLSIHPSVLLDNCQSTKFHEIYIVMLLLLHFRFRLVT